MDKQHLIYSFVAKGTVVLAEHTWFFGNIRTVAIQCLAKLPQNDNIFTYSCDGHTFNFLVEKGFVFLVVANEGLGQSAPFVFLERVKEDFVQQYGSAIDDEGRDSHLLSISYSLDCDFGPRLKEHMQYCINHPEEMSKLTNLTKMKGIMMDNIENVLDRNEKIKLIVDKTEILHFQAPTSKLSNRMYAIRDMQAQTSMDSPMLFLMQLLHQLNTVDVVDGRGGKTLHPNGVVRDVQLLSPRPNRNELKFEHVTQKFSLPIKEAARDLKVSVSTLNFRCRELGNSKWPYRKIQSLETLIETMLELEPFGFHHVIGKVREEIEAIKLNPALEIKYETERLRQEIYDSKYKRRRTSELTS
ncbi:Vesicle-associated membrane protein 727 [Rhynchospora pubera]|uniref:Vesicle-associated membrane protein 727 n=1 Tax=Rhynchospora pubera TaxID=906938 RepID=A0AAV8GRL8_9POAL|nr:Vesicle-associated membrane protein 727 [Rhynchospora pubera]KAJ4818381.1 Vesicle-associated membrane protein 727 [Rhynchospora pubera]